MPMYKPVGWSSSVPDGLYHDDKDGKHIDYANAVSDPANDKVFWICHMYADAAANGYRMIVKKVITE